MGRLDLATLKRLLALRIYEAGIPEMAGLGKGNTGSPPGGRWKEITCSEPQGLAHLWGRQSILTEAARGDLRTPSLRSGSVWLAQEQKLTLCHI